MLKRDAGIKKVVLFTGHCDMRKGIDGLCALVRLKYNLEPIEKGTLFLFCGRKRDRLKGLIYEGDGFVLAYKRLTSGRYNWPGNTDEAWGISMEEYDRLLSGFTIKSTIR